MQQPLLVFGLARSRVWAPWVGPAANSAASPEATHSHRQTAAGSMARLCRRCAGVVRALAWAVCCTLLGWSPEDSQQILCSPPVWFITPMGHECLPQQQPKQACACVL